MAKQRRSYWERREKAIDASLYRAMRRVEALVRSLEQAPKRRTGKKQKTLSVRQIASALKRIDNDLGRAAMLRSEAQDEVVVWRRGEAEP